MDTTHLIFSTPLSPICLRLFLCSPLSCAHKHCCHCDRHKHRNTHHQLSVSMHTQTDTHEIRIFMPFRQDVLNFCVSFLPQYFRCHIILTSSLSSSQLALSSLFLIFLLLLRSPLFVHVVILSLCLQFCLLPLLTDEWKPF